MARSNDPTLQLLHRLRTERDDWRRIAQNRAAEIERLRQELQELEALLQPRSAVRGRRTG
jgi:hypothetical protein